MTALAAHGRHHRPPLHRRALHGIRLAALRLLAAIAGRRLRRRIEEGRDDAYVVRIAPHGTIPPLVVARTAVATMNAVTDAFNVPPAAVLPDDDTDAPEHLRPGQYGDDWPTGQFTAIGKGWMT